ncbi:MAG TPA: T9SS type A sorting domain-containing protein [Chitinophagaceae bacterium]|nr:T9SS type A sorting domain-containing protein [Chitinophagaceae bacterium]
MKRTIISILVLAGVVVAVMYYAAARPGVDSYEFEEAEKQSGVNKQLNSWWWSRAYPEPGDINEKFYQAWLHAQSMKKPSDILYRNPAFSGNWQGIGPSQNIGGRILCIAVDPQNSNNLFAGSASGGIWKSVTGGAGTNAWQHVVTGFPVLGVASLIIHPANSNIIYAGTGEVYRTDTSNIGFNVWKARGTYGVGILKTTNGGITWSQVFNRPMSGLFGVQMLKFDPLNADIVYACTTDGLYKTLNAGGTWTRILNKIYVSDIAIHPTDPNQLVAAVGNLQNSDKGIYRSTDGGVAWTKITNGLPASFDGFIRLDNVSAAPGVIVASIGRSAGTSQNELFRSTDFGSSWTVLSNSNHCQYQFWFAHDVAINPSNTNQLVMGGVPLYRFTLPSSRTSIGGVHADVHDVEFDPRNSNTVYVACDGGVYKSTNAGGSFSMINGGLQAVQFYASLAVSPANPNIIVGGLQDNGVVRYSGTSWSSVAGGDGGPCAFHPTNGNIVFASNDARRVVRSTNGGTGFGAEVLNSWAFVADSRTGFMAPIAVSKSNPSIVYVASDNLHKSTSGGTAGSWSGNNYSSATNYIEARHKTGVALAVSPTNANKLYVSTSPFAQYDNDVNNLHVNQPPNVLKSTNGGTSFTSIKGSLPDRFVMDFAISPTNDDSVWIVLGGYGTSHVYVTANGGLTWTSKGGNLPDVPHNAILLDPRDPNIVYVGNDLGVYVSFNQGISWWDYNTGLWDATLVMDLVATSANKLVAATHGKGVFVSDLYMARLSFELLNFSGVNKGDHNQLSWATAMEENAQAFELERSTDGGNFRRIAAIPAANAASGSKYNYNDDDAIVKNSPVMYYRLKMIDKDGQFSYSNIVSLRVHTGTNIIITGNPFGNELKLSLTSGSSNVVVLKLYDAAGKLVAGKTYSLNAGTHELQLSNLSALPRGTYVLDVQAGSKKFAYKVIH